MQLPLSMWNFQDHIKKTQQKPKIDNSIAKDYNHSSPNGEDHATTKNESETIKKTIHQNSIKITQKKYAPYHNAGWLEAIGPTIDPNNPIHIRIIQNLERGAFDRTDAVSIKHLREK